MPPLLYLDTARLGQMSPAARDAQLDFVRLTAEEPSSLYFEDFLRGGFSAWPASYQQRFPGLCSWSGVSGLKQSLLQLAGAPADWQVVLANRSLSLVNLATRCQFRVCRNVLATDLSWPTYQQALERRAKATRNRVTTITLREQILRCGWTNSDVVDHLAAASVENHCDGLFLPAVDHFGIRLPFREIIQRIEQVAELRFAFLDAAQAFCQVPIDDCFDCADFVVAGAHKWMHAYLPMGVGYFGRRRSRHLIEQQLLTLRHQGQTNDPLLDFTEQLANGDLNDHFETANLACLLSSAGAVADRVNVNPNCEGTAGEGENLIAGLQTRLRDWSPLFSPTGMRSRIVLFQESSQAAFQASPDAIRKMWLSAGAIISAYPNGLARISIPGTLSSGIEQNQ